MMTLPDGRRPESHLPPGCEPDLEHCVTEDDEPVESVFHERQQKLLTDVLEASEALPRPFVALSNVGVFYTDRDPAIVPDMLLSLGVQLPENVFEKGSRSYFIWRYGKPPDLVVEIVSGTEGGELSRKLELYNRIQVGYYAVYDPERHLGKRALRLFERRGSSLVELVDPRAPLTDLGLRCELWDGIYAQLEFRWLRFTDLDGRLLPTGAERASETAARADSETARADSETARADREAARADLLAARLRELGLDAE